MGRQLDLKKHCLLCLKDVVPSSQSWHSGNCKVLYERTTAGPGFTNIATMCDDCLGYIRGENWPPAVYALLTEGRKTGGEQPVEVAA